MRVIITDDGRAIPVEFETEVRVKRLGEIDRIYEYRVLEDRSVSYRTKNSVNDTKLDNNLIRAKNAIKEYALCNPWTYFCTMTLSSVNGDRYNLQEFQKRLSKWINNYNTSHGCKIKYVLIPEYHKDNAVHFHGILEDIPIDTFSINEHGYLDWEDYKRAFGYISISIIRDNVAVANYITKYITKELGKRSKDLGQHLYISSKGLKRGEVIYTSKGTLNYWSKENEFCKIIEINNETEDYMLYIDDMSFGEQ